MYPQPDRPLRRLRIIAIIVALVLLVRWIIAATEPPNRQLIELVSLLVHVQMSSTLVANALTFTAVILAAAIIPLTVVWSLQRAERPTRKTNPETTHASIQSPDAPKALDGDSRAALPVRGDHEIAARTAEPEKSGDHQAK
jgi:hypothetical protein